MILRDRYVERAAPITEPTKAAEMAKKRLMSLNTHIVSKKEKEHPFNPRITQMLQLL